MKYYITDDLEQQLCFTVADGVLGEFRSKLFYNLNSIFGDGNVEVVSYDSMRSFFLEQQKDPGNEFVIGCDEGIYSGAQCNFSSTRVYDSIKSIVDGGYAILQRNGLPIDEQIFRIVSDYYQNKSKKVVLCDDGIFSGDTTTKIINTLRLAQIKVNEIRCIMNFSNKKNIEGVPVTAMYNIPSCIDWIDERDFVYGTPLGGATVKGSMGMFGVPYIYNSNIATKKASIPSKDSVGFCESLGVMNKNLWDDIQQRNDGIFLKDIERVKPLFSN